jgi:valyl-tRNA synthetase
VFEAIVPICDRKIPIISDPYVDIEFGTGCLKVTPAHDLNDYNLGNKHKLEIIDIFDSKGRFNENGLHYKNKDRFEVRKEIVKELKEKKILNKSEVKHKVRISFIFWVNTNCSITKNCFRSGCCNN